MSMLVDAFPEAQLLITGILGAESNTHGPNRSLHVPDAQRLPTCVATVLADHRQRGELAAAA